MAALLALAAVVWVASGALNSEAPVAEKTVADRNAQETAEIRVRTKELSAVDHPRVLVVTGRTNAIKDAEIKAETAGLVIARPTRKGSVVEKGAVLLELAMDDRSARLRDAEAKVGVAKITFEASRNLQRKQFESEIKLAQSNADLAKAEAELAAVKLDISRTKIRAPIAGFVETLLPGPGDYVEVGELVSMVVDLDPMRIIVNVTERDVDFLHLDDLVTIRLPNGREVGGTIRYISRVASETTRTFRVDIWTDNPDGAIPAGQTAEVQLNAGTRKAHQIPSSALTLNDQGVLGVRILDEDDIVRFMPVTLLDGTPEGAWVHGLPDRTRIITVGQEFVVEGQKVEPVSDAENTPKPAGGAS
ncbi:MAG: efflux RND transporter periplasmic adaptor subunit [Rhodospirillales bacterium]